jgi:GT2 family glycosyltransferase
MAHHNSIYLSVVIVSFNTAALLYNCLRSLLEACEKLATEVIVVDNASEDGSAEMVRNSFSQVRLIANQQNVGFGVANNQAIAAACGKYVLLLNSDTIVWPGAIEQLLCEIERDPGLALVGPRLMGSDGRWQRSAFRFPTPGVLLLEQLNIARFVSEYPEGRQHTGASLSVDWLIGACVLGRRDLLASLGPFDPRFFMYGEDIDLCYRLRKAGWDIRIVLSATITHLGAMSARHNPVRMALQATESMYLFYRKHYGRRALALATLIFRSVAAVKSLRDLGRWAWLTLTGRNHQQRARLLTDIRVWIGVVLLDPPLLEPPSTCGWNGASRPLDQKSVLSLEEGSSEWMAPTPEARPEVER